MLTLGLSIGFGGGSHNDRSVFSWSDGRNLRKLYWRNQGGHCWGGFIISTIVALGQLVFIKFLVPATIPDTIMWAGETDEFLLFWIFALFGRLFG